MSGSRGAALGILLALAAGELLARAWHFVPLHYDPRLGYIHAPGREFVMREEGNGSGRWGPDGIRRLEIVSGSDAPYLLALGDSYVEALQVGDEDVFSTDLERRLLADGRRFRVGAAGWGGWSAADYAGRAPDFPGASRPSWAIVVLSHFDLEAAAWNPGRGNCFFFREADGRLAVKRVIRRPVYGDTMRRIRSLSALAWLSDWRFRDFRTGASAEAPLFHAARVEVAAPGAIEASYPLEEEMDLLVKAWGSRVTILIHGAFDGKAPLAYTPFEDRMARWARARGVSCVNLREEYPSLARRGLSPYGFPDTGYNWGHWNADGHAAVARVLEREILSLRQRGLL